MQGSEFGVFRIQGLGFRVPRLGFKVWDLGFRVQGSGFRVWGSGFGEGGLGYRVWGLVCRGVGFRFGFSHFRVDLAKGLGIQG